MHFRTTCQLKMQSDIGSLSPEALCKGLYVPRLLYTTSLRVVDEKFGRGLISLPTMDENAKFHCKMGRSVHIINLIANVAPTHSTMDPPSDFLIRGLPSQWNKEATGRVGLHACQVGCMHALLP